MLAAFRGDPSGETHRDEIFSSISDGIYIKSMLGFGQSNMMNGEISGNLLLAFRIRNGELTGRVKDTMIAGNFYEAMKQGVEADSDIDAVSRMPYLKITGLSASAKP